MHRSQVYQSFEQLVGRAKERKETLHFVTAREMANIIFAACDGKDGNPGDYRDYRFKLFKDLPLAVEESDSRPVITSTNAGASVTLKG